MTQREKTWKALLVKLRNELAEIHEFGRVERIALREQELRSILDRIHEINKALEMRP